MSPDGDNKQGEGRAYILTSPGFLAGLALLLANDFALKPLFHNWLTGKLSDFAGLFVFPLFWSALFPRSRRAAYHLTAALFVLWKSPASQPLLDAWNGLGVLPLARTPDATDLVALAVLPLSFVYGARLRRTDARGLAPRLVAAASLLAFAATSVSTEYPYDNKYPFHESKRELTRKMHHMAHLDSRFRIGRCSRLGPTPGEITLEIPSNFCSDRIEATVRVEEAEGGSVLALTKMEHSCPEGKDDRQKMLTLFEEVFIKRLSQINLDRPAGSGTGEAPAPTPEPPSRKGQIYFVSVGELPGVGVESLTEHFRRKFKARVSILPALPMADEVSIYGRPSAAKLVKYVARHYPKEAESLDSAFVILIDQMTVEQSGNRVYNFALDLEGRYGIVAAEELNPENFCEPADARLLETRLRKVVARMLRTLYSRLPASGDPQSVLYTGLGCVDELDQQGEDF